mmetsp:Transcript_10276/g.11381  ORF Transcript_10276/g.11381 Transcript_10276/m.11381 type:complete len:339 (-) Transcript_10276:29-1045(-)
MTLAQEQVAPKNGDNEEHSSSSPPSLPPLYFIEEKKQNNISQDAANTSMFEELPSEVLSYITNFLDWGDYARLSPVNSKFQCIVQDAATHGGNESKWDLALALLDGTNGLESNPALAMKYLQEISGVVVSKDNFDPSYEGATSTISKSENFNQVCAEGAEENSHCTEAMRKISKCFFEGDGVEKDCTLGLAWLKAANVHGDLEAAYETATIYEYSKYGVEVDIYQAVEWFHGAAKTGHVESMAEYAMCLELGCGVEQSDDFALDWYTKAAERGHVTANFSVGEMFEEARGGVPQSDSEAVLWYYKAALMGDEDSKKALVRLNDIARIVVPGWAAILNV